MDIDLSPLDEFLVANDLDAYLIRASGENADQRYLSGFDAPDPYFTLYTGAKTHILVRGLESSRARIESRADGVATAADYDRQALVDEHGSQAADRYVLTRFLREHGVESIAVPSEFPVAIADSLRDSEILITPDSDNVVREIRAVKTPQEIDYIRQTQRATERAMERADELLKSGQIDGDRITHKASTLTSERIKEVIEVTLLRNGCYPADTVVASGADAAQPHHRGSGPIRPHEPIVIDIFPRHRDTNYYADMTRTFCVGEPSETAAEWYRLTLDAMDAAFDCLKAGVSGEVVHDAVCEVYETADIPTLRTDERTETGFIHSTGHGVGLDIHDPPRLGPGCGELEVGNVVTVEPGVYDPAVGGIRIEDLVVVTEDGFENLTSYPTDFVR